MATWSFWRHAIFSPPAAARILATVGGLYLLMEVFDFFKLYTRDQYSQFAILPLLAVAIGYVIISRRPITRIEYKLLNRDYVVEVRIGDLFSGDNDVVVSTNTTFDTNMANGLISTESLQGQVATRFFNSNTSDIDVQLDRQLRAVEHVERQDAPGKTKEYPIGTVARVESHGRTFYFVAMARLSPEGTASSSLREIEDALESLWRFITARGELKPLSISVMGTGRGRTGYPRKKMVERIAQSFAEGSRDRVFAPRLTIVVRPEDAENFGVNLYEIRDYLAQSLHP